MVSASIVLALVLCAAWTTRGASVVRDMRIASRANASAVAVAEGQESTQGLFLFHSYGLWVEFVDEAGVKHEGRATFQTMFVSANDDVRPVVHYEQGHPEEFVLNWATDAVVWRWVDVLLTWLIGLGVCWVLYFFGRRSLRQLTLHARIAERGEEQRCRVIEIAPQTINEKPTGELRCRYALPATATATATATASSTGERENHIDFYPSAEPVFLAKRTQILVLWDAALPDHSLVIRGDGSPLALDEAAVRVLRERAAEEA
jgi:hypothetical protein